MSFVHGHAREATWVVSHLRAPNRPERGQLQLGGLPAGDEEEPAGVEEPAGADVVIPAPREAVEDLSQASRSGR